MSNGSTFVSPHCWTNNVRQFDPSLTMELCHLYSLLDINDKSHETLRLSLPSFNLRKTRSQKKITTYLKTDICLLLDSGNFNKTSKQESICCYR